MTTPNQAQTVVDIHPSYDSPELAQKNQDTLDIRRDDAVRLARQTLDILAAGEYVSAEGQHIFLRDAVDKAVASKVSISPEAPLPSISQESPCDRLRISVTNETTLNAARRLSANARLLALNFASPTHPGGGFLNGARAQEEALARSSALFATLQGDAMYSEHETHYDPMATAWSILSPDVPVFRTDSGVLLEDFWLCTFLTCAAPQAKRVTSGDPSAAMKERIQRVLSIAQSYGYDTLVLGAWGCGAFGNDPVVVAECFREALLGPFLGAFQEVIFAITDWSPERRFFGPFREAFNKG